MNYAICQRTSYYGHPATSQHDVLDQTRDWRAANVIAARRRDELRRNGLVELPHNAYERVVVICEIEQQGRTDDCVLACDHDGRNLWLRDPDFDTSEDPREVAADLLDS